MRATVLFLACMLLGACGQDRVHTERVEICSSDSPPLVLPDEIVCNYPDHDTVAVDTKKKKYLCTVTWESPEDDDNE